MKKLVIIGGGFSGSIIAKELENHFDTTLIDSKSYFEYTPGILRTIVEPSHIKKVQSLHNHYLKKSNIVVSHVKDITKDEVILKGNDKVPYDYLVIASGSAYHLPIKEKNVVLATRADHLKKYHEKLCRSKDILIIGGGLVGVELASEIASHYKDKEITVIHSKERLIDRNNKKSSYYAAKYLLNKGVKIILNQEAKIIKNSVILDNGKKELFDIAFICTGIKPNFEFMNRNFKSSLDEKNFIKVNDYFQLSGEKNIFVSGDITGINEEKTAQTAEFHAKLIIENILRHERGEPLIKYSSKKRPMVISLGKWNGIFEHKNFVLTGLIPAFMKRIIEWKAVRYRRS